MRYYGAQIVVVANESCSAAVLLRAWVYDCQASFASALCVQIRTHVIRTRSAARYPHLGRSAFTAVIGSRVTPVGIPGERNTAASCEVAPFVSVVTIRLWRPALWSRSPALVQRCMGC